MTRRAVLTVGGLTLLAGCSANLVERAANVAATRSTRVNLVGRVAKPAGPRSTPGLLPPPDHGSSTPRTTQRGNIRPTDGQPMYHLDDGPKAIALTIDDGPDAVYTPQVLRLLAKYNVTATFSMIGIQVAAEPAVAREVAAAGHVISNHTWRHLDLGWLAPSAVVAEMDQATDAIHRAMGVTPGLFRAPYGVWNQAALQHCQKTGMTPLDWSVDPRDWSRPGVYAIVDNIMRYTETGSIILEHDGGGDRSETVAALRIVIPRLLDAGYHFVTP